MMSIINYFSKSIKRQLIFAIVVTHAILMTIFIIDLVGNQKDFLHKESVSQAKSLAYTLSKNSTSWILSNDYIGMEEIINSLKEYPNLEYAMLLNTNGKVLAHTNDMFVNKYVSDDKSSILFDSKKIEVLVEDDQIIDIATPVYFNEKHLGWARVALSQKNIQNGIDYITLRGMIYALIAIFIGWLFAYFMAKKLTDSLYSIIDVTKNIATGKIDIRAKSNRNDELKVLTNNINYMLDQLKNKEEKIISINKTLKESEYRWKFAIEGSGDGLWDWDIENNKVYLSKQWKSIIGYKENEYENSFINWENSLHIDDKQKVHEELNKNLHENLDFYEVEFRMLCKNGKYKWILARGSIVERDKAGNPLRMIGTHRDIDENKILRLELQKLNNSLEDKINEQTKELQEINDNLEKKVEKQLQSLRQNDIFMLQQSKLAAMGEMIGNIAHQWRQPLSAISTLSTGASFKKELGTLSDEEFNNDMNLINDNVQYLSKTIDTFRDFLISDKSSREVVLQERIEAALNLMSASITNHKIKVMKDLCEKELIIKIPEGELIQVIINIINNSRDALLENNIENPWIKITLEEDNAYIIAIEDNARGIDESIISKVFDPYFTTKDKSVGTGLGLSMSYKIVTNSLHGKIRVENTENGAKFFIELPKNS